MKHILPHREDSGYFYNEELKLVTTENMQDPETRDEFLSKYREVANKNYPFETLVYEGQAVVVNHIMETIGDQMDAGSYSKKAAVVRLSLIT